VANPQDLEIKIRAKDEASPVLDKLRKSTEGLGGDLGETAKAGAAFGTGFEIATKAVEKLINVVVGAAQAIGKLAEEAEHISNKALITGFATDSVQALERLAKTSGLSGEAVFDAINRMQKAAVEGKKGFTQLGLGMQEFLKLAPEDQLRTIAERIMAFPTAAERAASAMALFGKSGAELIPILKELAERGTVDVVAMSEAQIEALEKLDDSLDKLSGAWKDFTDQVIASAAQAGGTAFLDALSSQLSGIAAILRDEGFASTLKMLLALGTGSIGAMAQTAIAGASAGFKPLPVISGGLSAGLGAFGQTGPGGGVMAPGALMFPGSGVLSADPEAREKEVAKEIKAAEKVASERARIAKRLGDELERLEQRQIDGAMKVERAQIESFEKLDKAAAAHTASVMADDERAWDAQEKMLREEEALSAKMAAAEAKALDQIRKHREAVADSFGSVADVFGNVREALVAMGVDGSSALMRVTTGLQTAASAASGFMSALAKGDTFGMIGSAIGGAIGIASALGIGGNKEVMKVNDLRDAFFEAHGGWLALQKDLAAITDQDLVRKIFNAKTVEEFNAAVAQAMNLLDTQTRAQEELQAAVEKYGITIEELGPKFAQQELDKQAGQLLKEWELLIAAGVNVNVLLEKMGPSLIDFVETSIAAGATIPKAMQPVIDQLIASGQLLDENGNAYQSAEEAGITYAETLTEAIGSVVEEIRNLVAALTGIPRNVDTTVTTHHRDTYSEERQQGGDQMEEFARGGVALPRNVLPFIPRAANGIVAAQPGGTPVVVGEGGQAELVAPVAALADRIGRAAAAAAAGGGGQTIHVHVEIDKREIANAVVKLNRSGAIPIDAGSIRKTS
jgi:hypothetical protein